VEQLQLLGYQSAAEESHPRDIAPRPDEAGYEPEIHRVIAGREDDRYRRGAVLAASAEGLFAAITATFTPQRSLLPSGPWRNAVTCCVESASHVLRRNPITGIAGCCARAASGHATAAAPSSVMNSRRCISGLMVEVPTTIGVCRRSRDRWCVIFPWAPLGG
jgi:hypothetical protein